MKKTNKQKYRQNKTKKKVGGVAPIIMVIEHLPGIINVASTTFEKIMTWINTTNKAIDNYQTIKKITTTKTTDTPEPTKPTTVAPTVPKKPITVAPKKPITVAPPVPKKPTTVAPPVPKKQ